jgi:hypothetical protein
MLTREWNAGWTDGFKAGVTLTLVVLAFAYLLFG